MTTPDFDVQEGQPKSDLAAPIGRVVLLALLKEFGRSPRILEFFGLYEELKDVYDSEVIPEEPGFVYKFRIGLQTIS